MSDTPASPAERAPAAGSPRSASGAGGGGYSEFKRAGGALYRSTEVDGRRCFPTLAAVPDPVGGLVLAVPPEPTSALVRAAAERGFRDIWMQQGSESPDAVRFCQEQGINAIHGECILMFADPTGVHRFHRWLWGLLGKLPTASPGATG